MSQKAYNHLAAWADRIGWPVSHATDLTEHDHARLTGPDAPDTFGWVLRELGTLLLDPRMGSDGVEAYVAHLTESGRCEGDRFFWWDGANLWEYPVETWAGMLRRANAKLAPGRERTEHNRY